MTNRIDQPREFDLVGNPVHGAAFTLDRLFVEVFEISDPDLISPGQVLRVPIGS